MKQIVLQITDIHQNVFVNAGRILAYLNQFFMKYMNAMQYCENLENGSLFIFQNFEAFVHRTLPLSPLVLKEVPPRKIPRINFFKYFFLSKKRFPSNGIELHVKAVFGDPQLVLPLVKKFIQSVDKRISFRDIDARTILFHVPHYEILQKYLNSLIHRFWIRK
jgi:hypothetical protein